jgi:hypothetical protein
MRRYNAGAGYSKTNEKTKYISGGLGGREGQEDGKVRKPIACDVTTPVRKEAMRARQK